MPFQLEQNRSNTGALANSYTVAKQDFAVHSGLIWKQQMFSPEQ